jgi:hypothetical protein
MKHYEFKRSLPDGIRITLANLAKKRDYLVHYSETGHFTPISAGFVGVPSSGYNNPTVVPWWKSTFTVAGEPFIFEDHNFVVNEEEQTAIDYFWNMFQYKPEGLMFSRVDADCVLPLHVDTTGRTNIDVKVRQSSLAFPLDPFSEDEWGYPMTDKVKIPFSTCYGISHQKMHGVDNTGNPTRYCIQASFYDPLDEIFSRYCQGRLFYK